MTWSPYPPLPLAAVQDLLGITRALYRLAMEAEPRDACRLQALEEIGRTLRAVLRERRAPAGTIDHGNAWAAAERATKALTVLVADSPVLAQLIGATARLVARHGSMV